MNRVKLIDLKPCQPLVEDRTCFLNSQLVEIELKRKDKFSQALLIPNFFIQKLFFSFQGTDCTGLPSRKAGIGLPSEH
jgi:hypothetical protein